MRWIRRTLDSEGRKAYDAHTGEVADTMRRWKNTAERHGVPATRELITEAKISAWEAPRIQSLIENEMRASAASIHSRGFDTQLEERVRKISLVRCLMGLLDKMRENAVASGNSTIVMGLSTLSDKMMWLLDDSYFFKSERQVRREYLELQPALVACGGLTKVRVPGLREMADKHRNDVASTIGKYTVELDRAARARGETVPIDLY